MSDDLAERLLEARAAGDYCPECLERINAEAEIINEADAKRIEELRRG